MKIAALLSRAKGRDFYDTMFLMSQTVPDYGFLKSRAGLGDLSEMKSAANKLLENVDLSIKRRDFEHLLFNSENSEKILRFPEFINSLA